MFFRFADVFNQLYGLLPHLRGAFFSSRLTFSMSFDFSDTHYLPATNSTPARQPPECAHAASNGGTFVSLIGIELQSPSQTATKGVAFINVGGVVFHDVLDLSSEDFSWK